jgi:hypothetical protein
MKNIVAILLIGIAALGARAQSMMPIGDANFENVLVMEAVNQEIYAISYNDKKEEYRLMHFDLIEWNDLGALPKLPTEGKSQDGEFHLNDLQFFKGELYLCGSYVFNAGNQQKNIALVYDGVEWKDIATPVIENSVQLTKYLIYNDRITLVGIFSTVQPINLLTYANGNWSPLGDFITYDKQDDYLTDAYIWKGKIYASGVFSKPRTTGKRYLISFDGLEWKFSPSPPFLHKNTYFAIHKKHLVLTGTLNAPTISEYDYFKRYSGVGTSWETYSDGLEGIEILDVESMVSDGKVLWATGIFVQKSSKDTFYLLYNKDDYWLRAETSLQEAHRLIIWNKQAVIHGTHVLYGTSSIAALGEGIAYVQGNVFNDLNSNCLMDASEMGTIHHELVLEPGGHRIFTNSDGSFAFEVLKGNYTLKLVSGPFWSPTCGATALFTADKYTNLGHVFFGMNKVPDKVDVEVFLHDFKGQKVKAGAKEHFVLELSNNGTKDVGEFKVQVRITPASANAKFSIPPISYVDGVATWHIASMGEGTKSYIYIDIDIPNSEDNLSIAYELKLSGEFGDIISGNNSDSISYGRYVDDENFMKTGKQQEMLAPNTTELGYDIFFRNVGSQTVNKILVIDTLDEDIRLIRSQAHSYPDHDGFDIESRLLPSGRYQRTFKWVFTTAELPDSASDPVGSMGHINYDLWMNEGSLPKLAVVCNQAQIFIENLEPITTNEVCSQLTGSVPQINSAKLSIYPNPSSGTIVVTNVLDHMKTLQIMGMDGRVVMTIEAAAFEKTTFDLSHLNKGVYFIRTQGYRAYKLFLQ